MSLHLTLLPDPTHTDPIAVRAGTLLAPGRLALTSAPGRRSGNVETDLAALAALGVTALVSLVPLADRRPQGLDDLPALAAAHRLELMAFAIDDFSVPTSIAATLELVDEILGRTRDGATVAIHCGAGLGRTGTIAACCLARLGMVANEAIDAVRTVRPGSVETDAQARFVADFATYVGRSP